MWTRASGGLLVLLALVAGCGGGSEAAPPAADETGGRLEAACRTYRATVARLPDAPSSRPEYRAALRAQLAAAERLQSDIQAVQDEDARRARLLAAAADRDERSNSFQRVLVPGDDWRDKVANFRPGFDYAEQNFDAAVKRTRIDCPGG